MANKNTNELTKENFLQEFLSQIKINFYNQYYSVVRG